MSCSNCYGLYREYNPGQPAGETPPAVTSGVVYFSGGLNEVSNAIAIASRTRKMAIGSSVINTIASAALSVARTESGGMGNVDKGFICGGGTAISGTSTTPLSQRSVSTRTNVTDRLTYSTDILAAVSGANLSNNRNGPAGCGDASKGFMAGGETATSTNSSINNKIDYSTEVSSTVAGAALTLARKDLAATGNITHGYYSGGTGSTRRIDKLDYSTETMALISSTGLPSSKIRSAFFGNTTDGYLTGGGSIIPAVSVQIIDYATDTAAAGVDMLIGHFSGGGGSNTTTGVVPSVGMSVFDMTTEIWSALGVNLDTVHHRNVAVSTGIFTV